MTHIAIATLQDGRAVDWLEQVTDAQYQGVSKTRANTVGTPERTGPVESARKSTFHLCPAPDQARDFIRSRISVRSSSCVGPLAASTTASSLISVTFARFTALTSRKTTQAMIRKFSSAMRKAP